MAPVFVKARCCFLGVVVADFRNMAWDAFSVFALAVFFFLCCGRSRSKAGPDSERSGKKACKKYELFGFTTEAHHRNTNKKRTDGNSDEPQISRPDFRFASRKTAKQHKTGPEPHQTKPHKSMWIASGSSMADNALRLGPYMRRSSLK